VDQNSDGGHIYRRFVSDRMRTSRLQGSAQRQAHRHLGIHSERRNNAYLLDFRGRQYRENDAKTRNATVYPTPTPDSRRGAVASITKAVVVCRISGQRNRHVDPKTERITEWKVADAWSGPMDAVAGRNGEGLGRGPWTDRVSASTCKSASTRNTCCPRPTNIRRVYLDDRGALERLWIGRNHGASIVKVEPPRLALEADRATVAAIVREQTARRGRARAPVQRRARNGERKRA